MEVFAAVEISRPFESYPAELIEKVLPAREYLVFAAWIDPEIVTRKKCPVKSFIVQPLSM